jgi:hypothetical protein
LVPPTDAPAPSVPGHRRMRVGAGMPVLIAAQFAMLAVLYVVQWGLRIGGRRVWAVSDDIYISACYARSLAEGFGPVWYPGAPRVEGITNPLWTALLALAHALPFFREGQLGLYVFGLNAVLLVALGGLLWSVWRKLAPEEPRSSQDLAALALLLPLPSLVYWMAGGFEVGLVAVLGLAGLRLALAEAPSSRAVAAIGFFAGLAFWTRMDGVLYVAAAYILLASNRRCWNGRSIAGAVAIPVAMMAALFFARRFYYGEWLPNTYELKIAGWPVAERWAAGARQNAAILRLLPLLLIPPLIAGMLPVWRGAMRPYVAGALTFALVVLYSTHNGGDAWSTRFGYDRFAAAGTPFLATALAALVAQTPRRPGALATALVGALILALAPVLGDGRLKDDLAGLRNPEPEREWIAYGMALERISEPGARIATHPAGAIIYFSHRGGVDLLGKNDLRIARLPVNQPEQPPGHMKSYPAIQFAADRPEFSRPAPPPARRAAYERVTYEGHVFWVLRDTPLVRRDNLEGSELPTPSR